MPSTTSETELLKKIKERGRQYWWFYCPVAFTSVQIDEQKVLMAVCQVKMLMGFILRILEKWPWYEYIYTSYAFWDFKLLERYGVETQTPQSLSVVAIL
jgi:hypothetical protein